MRLRKGVASHAQVRRAKSYSSPRGHPHLVQMCLQHREARERLKQKARQRLQRQRWQGRRPPQIAFLKSQQQEENAPADVAAKRCCARLASCTKSRRLRNCGLRAERDGKPRLPKAFVTV